MVSLEMPITVGLVLAGGATVMDSLLKVAEILRSDRR